MRRLFGSAALILGLGAVLAAAEVRGMQKQLSSPHPHTRRAAAKALAETGPTGKSASAFLFQALAKDKYSYVRRYAAEALGTVGADPAVALQPLARALRDPQ